MDSLYKLLESKNIYLEEQVYTSIGHSIDKRLKNIHITFILDKKNEVITYGFNVFFKTDTFPYSIHSEINTITKYYRKQFNKNLNKKSKKMVIIKISPSIKKIGLSRPCSNCANFILNNMDNMNINEILYSTKEGTLESLKKNDLLKSNEFTKSSAFRKKFK